MTEELSDWTIHFNLGSPCLEKEIKGRINSVEFDTDACNLDIAGTKGIKITGFTITVKSTNKREAQLLAEGKGRIILNCLSSIHSHTITGYLTTMTSSKGEGFAEITGDGIIHGPEIIDLACINDVINSKDERYLRQLSHYARGLAATDLGNKYREFYQVYEDELTKTKKTKPPNYLKKTDEDDILRIIRHLLNHPRLTGSEAVTIANSILGKTSIDLDNIEDLKLVGNYLGKIQKKAEDLLKPGGCG